MDNIEQQALHYANLPLIDRQIVASVHLEDAEDKKFWLHRLQQVKPGKYNLVSYSKSAKDNNTTGCEQCLKYKGYLSKNFFIAIDSDIRYLVQQPGIDAAHYIAQTYTYSWENHYCEAVNLQHRFEKAFADEDKFAPFDFCAFLTELSVLLYKPLLLVVRNELSPTKCASLTTKKVFGAMPAQVRREWLADNGRVLLNEIAGKLAVVTGCADDKGLQAYANRLKELGITEKTAYLHVRGHNLYNMIRSMGTLLCGGTQIKFTTQVLCAEAPLHKPYWQRQSLEADLRTILL